MKSWMITYVTPWTSWRSIAGSFPPTLIFESNPHFFISAREQLLNDFVLGNSRLTSRIRRSYTHFLFSGVAAYDTVRSTVVDVIPAAASSRGSGTLWDLGRYAAAAAEQVRMSQVLCVPSANGSVPYYQVGLPFTARIFVWSS
jgi:hypothetical protein